MSEEPLKVYVDESGNTGDISLPRAYPTFGDQRGFALAAVVVPDQAELDEILARLTALHRIAGTEVKSKKVMSRPEFVSDLLEAIRRTRISSFLEYVDKKYYLCTQIVNTHVLPPSAGIGEEPPLRRIFCDYIYSSAPDSVFIAYCAACATPGPASLRSSMSEILRFAESSSSVVGEGIAEMLVESMDDYENMLAMDPEAHLGFLPLSDLSKRSTPIWILPHYSCLTNVYARVNRFGGGNKKVEFVHDEQHHFDEVLKSAISAAESLSWDAHPTYASGADYRFSSHASLAFARSTDSSGLQLADVIAGLARRGLESVTAGREIPQAAALVLDWLFSIGDPNSGVGMNLVAYLPIEA